MARLRKLKSVTDAGEPKARRPRGSKKPSVHTADPVPVAEVATEAYFLFLARNGQPGDPLHDWLTAERIVRERRLGGGAPGAASRPARGRV